MEKEDKVKNLLGEARDKIGADDVRFRPVDWMDKACVHVPGWIIGTGGARAEIEKEIEKEAELFRRVYFNPKDTCRIDCVVGYVARRYGIQQAMEKGTEMFKTLKKCTTEIGISEEDIISTTYLFPDVQNNNKVKYVFEQFIDRVRKNKDENNDFKIQWETYNGYLQELSSLTENDESFYKVAFDVSKIPSNINKKQWKQLWEYYQGKSDYQGRVRQKFIEAANKATKYYETLSNNWEKYESILNELGSEVVVPVVASDELLGVLNFHKKEGDFNNNPEEISKSYAAKIAAAFLLDWQIRVLNNIREIGESLDTRYSLRKVVSKIAKGVRKSMIGLEAEEIYPLLYSNDEPISLDDDLSDFGSMWKPCDGEEPQVNSKDHELWCMEKALFEIPIRENGLGYQVVKVWQGARESELIFKVAGDVDNPNSKNGSRSAYDKEIYTTGCLPLIFNNQVHGLLYLHCKRRHFFTKIEVYALRIIGTLAAIAITQDREESSIELPTYEKLYGSKLLKELGRLR